MPNSSEQVIFVSEVVDEFVGLFKRMVALARDFIEFFKTEEGMTEFAKGFRSFLVVFFLPLLVGFGIDSLGAFVVGHMLFLDWLHYSISKFRAGLLAFDDEFVDFFKFIVEVDEFVH